MGPWGLFLLRFWRAIFPTFSSVFNKFFQKSFCAKILYLYFCFSKFWKIKENQVFGNSILFFILYIHQEVFSSIFFVVLFSISLFSHILELSSQIYLLDLCIVRKIVCDPLRSPREYLWSLWLPSVLLSLLCARLSATSCEELCVVERGVVYSRYWIVTPQWRSLCGRSCVDIVKILLCEGGDVEQWLEPRNISYCLCLIHYLQTLSLLYLALLYIVHISYMFGIVCVPILVLNQESFI